MSTRITPDEYKTLKPVPKAMWHHRYVPAQGSQQEVAIPHSLGPCDVSPAHGSAVNFLKSPDNRAMACCNKCLEEVRAAGAKV